MKYGFYFLIEFKHRKETANIVSPKSFTLLCKIKTSELSDRERFLKLEDLVANIINQDQTTEIIRFRKINAIFDIHEFLTVIDQLLKIERNLILIQKRIESNIYAMNDYAAILLDLKAKKDSLRSQLAVLAQEVNASNFYKFTGWVFITFQTIEDLKKVFKRRSPLLKSFFWKFNSQWRTVPEPNDIIWENWSVPWSKKTLARVSILLVVILLIGVNFGVILGFKYLQSYIGKWIGSDNTTSTTTLQIIVSVAISIFIGVVNFLIRLLMVFFTKFETYKTYTTHFAEIVFKVVILQFVNKALIVLLTNKIIDPSQDWQIFGSSGVIGNMIVSMIINVFFDVIVYLVEPAYMIKLWNRLLIKKSQKKQTKRNFFQIEANEAFEGIKFDISEAYYLHFSTLCLAFFYQAIIPYGLIMGILEMICKYTVVKYVLVRRSVKPHDLEFEFTQKMFRQFEFTVVLLALGFVIFSIIFNSKNNQFDIYYVISISLAGFDWIFGGRILQIFTERASTAKIQNSFEFYELNFPVDYDRLNPITQKKAFREFLKKINYKEPLYPHEELEQFPELSEVADPEDLLNDYAIFRDDRLNNRNINLQNAAIFTAYFRPQKDNKRAPTLPSLYLFQTQLNDDRYRSNIISARNLHPDFEGQGSAEFHQTPPPNVFLQEFERATVQQSIINQTRVFNCSGSNFGHREDDVENSPMLSHTYPEVTSIRALYKNEDSVKKTHELDLQQMETNARVSLQRTNLTPTQENQTKRSLALKNPKQNSANPSSGNRFVGSTNMNFQQPRNSFSPIIESRHSNLRITETNFENILLPFPLQTESLEMVSNMTQEINLAFLPQESPKPDVGSSRIVPQQTIKPTVATYPTPISHTKKSQQRLKKIDTTDPAPTANAKSENK